DLELEAELVPFLDLSTDVVLHHLGDLGLQFAVLRGLVAGFDDQVAVLRVDSSRQLVLLDGKRDLGLAGLADPGADRLGNFFLRESADRCDDKDQGSDRNADHGLLLPGSEVKLDSKRKSTENGLGRGVRIREETVMVSWRAAARL